MEQFVIKVDNHLIDEMKNYYKNNLIDKVPQGAIFVAKTDDCTITGYKSGKVLFQGKNSMEEGEKWLGDIISTLDKKESKDRSTMLNPSPLPADFSNWSIIGSDEVGTGDYFGPITVVATYVDKEQIPLLIKLGVKDSKNLSDDKIIQIAKKIKDIVTYSLLVLHNEKYNQLQKGGMSQGKMKALLHNQAIHHVLEKISPKKPDGILIDQFVKKELYFQYLEETNVRYKELAYFHTQAENLHVAVACASILARYAFIQHMDLLSQKAGFSIPKGAGTGVDEAAARLIKEKGSEVLPFFVKLHFANTKKAFNLLKG